LQVALLVQPAVVLQPGVDVVADLVILETAAGGSRILIEFAAVVLQWAGSGEV
jgi:hypothetical protein